MRHAREAGPGFKAAAALALARSSDLVRDRADPEFGIGEDKRPPWRRRATYVVGRRARLPAVPITLAWVGDATPRMEVAHVRVRGTDLTAAGTQLGAVYELRYRLDRAVLRLELVGERSLELTLGDADFFDLGWSPLFNSLPVIRDQLLEPGPAHDYLMRWVDVPSLEVTTSEQRYEPLGRGLVRFSSGSFTADIQFDEHGFVLEYPGIAKRAQRGEAQARRP